MTTILPEDQPPVARFYSQRAITIASFFGGPLAAGILARQNFINQGNVRYGKYALVVGIFATTFLSLGIFSIPENILNKIPNLLIPLIYIGIIYLIIERYQGKKIKRHKEQNGKFYSAWKAFGIGTICMAVILCVVFLSVYLLPANSYENFDPQKYDNKIAQFNINEEKALALFTILESSSPEKSIKFIEAEGIRAWESNIQIINELDKIAGLPAQLFEQDKILKKYCSLRIESYKLIKKSLIDNTRIYDAEIERIGKEIDIEVSKLGK